MRLQFQHIVTITTSMGGGDGTRQIFKHRLELCKAAWKTIREQCTSLSEKHVVNQTTHDERKKNQKEASTTDKTRKSVKIIFS